MIKEVQSFEIKELFKDTQSPYRKYYVYEENNFSYMLPVLSDISLFAKLRRDDSKAQTKIFENYSY